jgi:hypothetical protein
MSSDAETRSRSEQAKHPVRLVLTAFWDEHTLALELPPDDIVVFGRGADCALRVDHPSVSRRHARFRAGRPVTVEDLQSRNGTVLRGTPLAVKQQVSVRSGDVIECGDVLLLLRAWSKDAPSPSAPCDPNALVVGTAGRWFQPPGAARINLGRRGPLRRVLFSLVERRLSSPGLGLNVRALIEVGWPGERILHDAALQRAYTTVQRLRALGLQQVLVTSDDGYLLSPTLAVRVEDG